MLAELTKEKFDPFVGQEFRILAGDDSSVAAKLIDCSTMRGDRSEGQREPFSLIFHAPAEPFLPQALYRVTHAELGDIELFLVPLGPHQGEGMRYEAVFT